MQIYQKKNKHYRNNDTKMKTLYKKYKATIFKSVQTASQTNSTIPIITCTLLKNNITISH